MGIIVDLERLSFALEALSYNEMEASTSMRHVFVVKINKPMSSTNILLQIWRDLVICIHVILPYVRSILKNDRRGCVVRAESMGERGHPCLTPF